MIMGSTSVPASDDFAGTCRRAASLLSQLNGYFLERVSTETGSSVDVFLRRGPSAPDVLVSFAGVLRMRMGYFMGAESAFVEEMRLICIPGVNAEWPDGLVGMGKRTAGNPDLAWFTLEGPVPVDVVANIVTVYVAKVY